MTAVSLTCSTDKSCLSNSLCNTSNTNCRLVVLISTLQAAWEAGLQGAAAPGRGSGVSPQQASLPSRRLRRRAKEEQGVVRGPPEPRRSAAALRTPYLFRREGLLSAFGASPDRKSTRLNSS